jgi:glutamate/tyrosine decarboxylase-like PLP-dependent enzyme
MHGTDKYKWAIERGLELAIKAGEIIDGLPNIELVRQPSLSCVLFRRIGWNAEDYKKWSFKNHKDGFALVTPTKWKNGNTYETVARFCFINPDTTEKDISGILETMK